MDRKRRLDRLSPQLRTEMANYLLTERFFGREEIGRMNDGELYEQYVFAHEEVDEMDGVSGDARRAERIDGPGER